MSIAINARFLCQPVSGVQRYAREITSALDDELRTNPALRDALGPVVALHPSRQPLVGEPPRWSVIRGRALAGGSGHVWEQTALFRASRASLLLSLGNSGPLAHPRQIIAFHDAHVFDMPEGFGRVYRHWHGWLRPRLAARAAALVTVSDHSAQRLAGHLGLPGSEAFHIIPNGVGHLQKVSSDPMVLRQHGLSPGQYLLCVGNQSPNKNVARLILAHRVAGTSMPPLAVVGGIAPGVAHAGLRSNGAVRLLGRVSDGALRALFENARAFVFPSLNEGFGIPPLEALDFGVPVLSARRGALPEVLGEAALWFDPEDVPDMALALRRFMKLSDAQLDLLRAQGRQRAAGFTWKRSARAFARLLLARSGVAPSEISRIVPYTSAEPAVRHPNTSARQRTG